MVWYYDSRTEGAPPPTVLSCCLGGLKKFRKSLDFFNVLMYNRGMMKREVLAGELGRGGYFDAIKTANYQR